SCVPLISRSIAKTRSVEPYAGRARRDPGFAPAVLRAYEHRCGVCAYDGQAGRISVGIEAAHVKCFSHGGPDVGENGLSLVHCTTRRSTLERSRSPTITGFWCPATFGSAANGRRAVQNQDRNSCCRPGRFARLVPRRRQPTDFPSVCRSEL